MQSSRLKRKGQILHKTLERFGYPDNTLVENESWALLLRPKQVTLGSLVLICKDAGASSLAHISADQLTDLPAFFASLEKVLRDEFGAQKFNYLALMMVDPHVHFHVLPRYDTPPVFQDTQFPDANWPGPPDLTISQPQSADSFKALHAHLSKRLKMVFGAA